MKERDFVNMITGVLLGIAIFFIIIIAGFQFDTAVLRDCNSVGVTKINDTYYQCEFQKIGEAYGNQD